MVQEEEEDAAEVKFKSEIIYETICLLAIFFGRMVSQPCSG